MSIFAVPMKELIRHHKRVLKRKRLTYNDVINALQKHCSMFPDASMAWPVMLRRKKVGDAYRVQAEIHVVKSTCGPGSKEYATIVKNTGKRPDFIAHKRVIEGENLKEVANQALEIIRAAKAVAEILTVLEETCPSEEASNT
jgi:hypothetical protein